MKILVKPNPEFDFLIGYIGNPEIPTKQDKFKPLKGRYLTDGELGKGLKFVEDELYVRDKKQTASQALFETTLTELILPELKKEHPYKGNIPIEAFITISMTEQRLNQVDVDNLAKSVLDCLNGLVFIDDSQVISLIVTKKTVALPQKNGIMIGIRKLSAVKRSLVEDIYFYESEEVEE